MKALGVIPARLHSTRLPEKVIRKICDKYIIQMVWERARSAKKLAKVVIATDHVRVRDIVESFGATVVMTKETHVSGTDRVGEVAKQYSYPVIVNIQGDEPLVRPQSIDLLVKAFEHDRTVSMATLCYRSTDKHMYGDPNVVKVVRDKDNNAVYFSRSPIPYYRDTKEIEFLKHIGMYAYRKSFLLKIPRLSASVLEQAEKLEQLRIVQNGHAIKVLEVTHDTIGVDTLDDLNAVEKILSR